MKLRTASEGVRFAMELEGKIDGFYSGLAARWPERADLLEMFEKTAHRNGETIKRTYYGAITDATEGGFCFDLDAEGFDTGEALSDSIAWPAAIALRRRETVAMLKEIETEQEA